MVKTKKKNIWSWIIASVGGTAFIIIAYILVATTSTSYNNGNIKAGMLSGAIALASVIVVVVAVITSFRAKRWYKLIPIICILLSLVTFGLAFFAYSFSGYGASH